MVDEMSDYERCYCSCGCTTNVAVEPHQKLFIFDWDEDEEEVFISDESDKVCLPCWDAHWDHECPIEEGEKEFDHSDVEFDVGYDLVKKRVDISIDGVDVSFTVKSHEDALVQVSRLTDALHRFSTYTAQAFNEEEPK